MLADDADSLTTARFKALDLHVMSKPDLSPVTDADKSVEASIRRTLSRVRSRDAVTGEEGPLLAGVVMAMHNDPELAAEMRALHSSKSPIAQVMCDRAEARGELRPGYNVDLIEEIVPGLMFMHSFVLGEPVDARFIGHLVDDIILPLLSR